MTVPVTAAVTPAVAPWPAGRPIAVLVARAGQLPPGADETVAEAGGLAIVCGSGAQEAAHSLTAAEQAWYAETGGLRPGSLGRALARLLVDVPLVVLPATPDGRDIAPRVAATLDRPLLAAAVSVGLVAANGGRNGQYDIEAELARLEDRLLIRTRCTAPAVATLLPGSRSASARSAVAPPQPLDLPDATAAGTGSAGEFADVEVLEVLEPRAETMDLAEAPRVLGGGAGLVPQGTDDAAARDLFTLLTRVGAALDSSIGATRVVTDAGWLGYDRQIGTTGVSISPELYVAFGVSGASQHIGGLGAPRHIVSVNTDPSCPMTAMADLGLVTDARLLLLELARRLGIEAGGETGSETGSENGTEEDRRDAN
jgi:electron transfer flavoprotein alpha subunit